MSTMTETTVTTQVYRVYIKATPQAIWDAITKPEWTGQTPMSPTSASTGRFSRSTRLGGSSRPGGWPWTTR